MKIYGYGGNLQNEALYAQDIRETDDLKEVPQYVVDGRHYFYARGAVSWSSPTATVRTAIPIQTMAIISSPRAMSRRVSGQIQPLSYLPAIRCRKIIILFMK